MVLYDSKGNFAWQSFDSPMDTLLMGQSLQAGVVSKLVSRASEKDNSNEPHSLVIEPKQLALYYTSKNSPKPLLYCTFARDMYHGNESLAQVTLDCAPETDEGYAYDITLKHLVTNQKGLTNSVVILGRPKYNCS
ncbi:hypothetical protein NL676_024024 [Syzygium grande]|nr:hypothetical protein NL676_024024 [Syzygium grande]